MRPKLPTGLLLSLPPGAHTATENHPASASFYCDSPRIKQGITPECAYDFVLYILRFDRRLDRNLVTEPYYSHKEAHGLLGSEFLIPPVYIATQSNQPVLHLHFDTVMGHQDIPLENICHCPGDILI